jgi:hypothetical protein
MSKISIFEIASHKRLLFEGKLTAAVAVAITFCFVIPAAGQYPAASVEENQPSALIGSVPGRPASKEFSPFVVGENSETFVYYWNSAPVADSAQLLTLFCRACGVLGGTEQDVPLVSVLRDTLGDQANENDRVTYIWLLTYARPHLEQRILSAIPFFYWRMGRGPGSVGVHDTKPLLELSAPEHPMTAQLGRDLVQWTAFDPLISPIRASTRAYGSNLLEDERVHREEALTYLRHAPVSNDTSALTQPQLDTVIARLELRDAPLGGLVDRTQAGRLGMHLGFEQERIRIRNRELLRQWAEKAGLIFEPLSLAGTQGQYAILWFPQEGSMEPTGSSQSSIWKLLGIRNPWNDDRLKDWKGPVYERALDENGSMRIIPLAVYSLDYPKLPLVMIDFRRKLGVRRREVLQRSISELTAGVLGLSHFTNWYFYIGMDSYNFVTARHGSPVREASRLDCYSDFRMELALDHSIDPVLKENIEGRMRWLSVNPLEAAPEREIQDATERYKLLAREAGDGGRLMALVGKERRFELASFGESEKGKAAKSMLHVVTRGLYTQQAKRDDVAMVDHDRRIANQLSFLDSLVQAETPPEVAYGDERVMSSVDELSSLIPTVSSRRIRLHAETTLENLKRLSEDAELQADCTTALAAIRETDPLRKTQATEVATLPAVGPGSPKQEGVK